MAYVEKLPSGKWRGVYRDPAGRKRSRSFAYRDAADRWAEDNEHDVRHGRYRDPSTRVPTVRAWSAEWMEGRVVESSTAAGDRQRMVRILEQWGDEPLDMLTTVGLQGWVKRLGRDMAPATVRKYHGLLSTMLTAAVRERLITENPCQWVQLPAVAAGSERFLTEDEVEAVVGVLPPPYDVVVHVLAYSGLRWGELAGLHVSAVDALRRTITVRETLAQVEGAPLSMKPYPKSTRPRRVPVSQHVVDAIAAHLAKSPAAPCGLPGHEKGCSGLIFRNRNGAPLSRHNFRKTLTLAAAKAGVEEFRPHDLRHTAASWLVQDGVPMQEIQNFLGHSTPMMTQRYTHLAPNTGDRVRSALDRSQMGQTWGKTKDKRL